MARQTVIKLVDDLDQSEATQTVRFGWGGASYEIDLSDDNAAAFEHAVAPYLARARKVSGRPAGGSRGGSSGRRNDRTAIRAWASENGYQVGDRGRIPAEIIDAYTAANGSPTGKSGRAAKHASAPKRASASKRGKAAVKATVKPAATSRRTGAQKRTAGKPGASRGRKNG